MNLELSEKEFKTLEKKAGQRNIHLSWPKSNFDFPELICRPKPAIRRRIFWLRYLAKCLAQIDLNKNLLDLGTNVNWLIGVSSTGRNITTVDFRSHPFADILPFRFIQANASHLPLPDRSFEIVTFPQILHWVGTGTYGDKVDVDGDRSTIAEISRVLAFGGTGIFTSFIRNGRTELKIGGRRIFAAEYLRNLFTEMNLRITEWNIYSPSCQILIGEEFQEYQGDEKMEDEGLCWVMGKVTPVNGTVDEGSIE